MKLMKLAAAPVSGAARLLLAEPNRLGRSQTGPPMSGLYPCQCIHKLTVVGFVAAVFGFGGVAAVATDAARILFFVFLVLFIVTLIFGRRPPRVE